MFFSVADQEMVVGQYGGMKKSIESCALDVFFSTAYSLVLITIDAVSCAYSSCMLVRVSSIS